MSNSVTRLWQQRSRATGQSRSTDDLFDVLSEARRRIVLTVLAEREASTDVETLARIVADREADDASENAVEDVHVTLHHVHLPKLHESGLVDYDREGRTVALARDDLDGVPIDVE